MYMRGSEGDTMSDNESDNLDRHTHSSIVCVSRQTDRQTDKLPIWIYKEVCVLISTDAFNANQLNLIFTTC